MPRYRCVYKCSSRQRNEVLSSPGTFSQRIAKQAMKSNFHSSILLKEAAIWSSGLDLNRFGGQRILITGASGLLGVNFLALLALAQQMGHAPQNVTALTHSPASDWLKNFAQEHDIELLQGDLSDCRFVESLPECDICIHAAGYGQPGKFMADPHKTILLNTAATAALLDRTDSKGHFLYVSSSEIYSGHPGPMHAETDIGTTDPQHFRACYIEGKRCGEAVCSSVGDSGPHAVAARLALAYGPGTKSGDARVLNNFIEKGLVGEIRLLDQGQAMRTYGYVGDSVRMMTRMLFEGKEPVYNVGGRSRVSIADLARAIGTILDVPVVLPETDASVSGAPDDVQLDLSRFEDEFGPLELTPLEYGLKKTIEWQRLIYGVD